MFRAVQNKESRTDSSVQFSGNNSSEERVTVENQKTSHWFMCYKFVKRVIVAQRSERSNKTRCQTSIHELLSRDMYYRFQPIAGIITYAAPDDR
jgi:hypothetical protein